MVDPILKEQHLPISEIISAGFSGVMTNAYILRKHGGIVTDIHSYLGYSGVVATDSGAYQILRYGDIDVSNREIVQYQCDIKSDIGVILDIPTASDVDRATAFRSADETYRRAVEVLDLIGGCSDTLWTLPIQGGTHLDILKQYAEKSIDIFYSGYSLYALGSPTTLLEQYEFDRIIDMIFTVRSVIPFSAPLHLFGAGHPLIVPFAVALGVDTMDSASYILYAKDDRYMTSRATYRLEDLSYFPCTCPVCSRYSPDDVEEMPKKKRVELLALHNLYTLSREFREVKQAIREGRFWEYLEYRAYSHPAVHRALERLKRYLEFIYRHTPIVKPDARAVYIMSEDSVFNPKVMIPRRRVLERFNFEAKCIDLIPYRRGASLDIRSVEAECESFVYFPILGVAPLHMVDRYPYSQFEFGFRVTDRIITDLSYLILELVLKMLKMVRPIVVNIYTCIDVEWQNELYRRLADLVQQIGETGIELVLRTVKCG